MAKMASTGLKFIFNGKRLEYQPTHVRINSHRASLQIAPKSPSLQKYTLKYPGLDATKPQPQS